MQQLFEASLEAGKSGRLGGQVIAAGKALFDLQAAVHQRRCTDDHQCAADAVQNLRHAAGSAAAIAWRRLSRSACMVCTNSDCIFAGTCSGGSLSCDRWTQGAPASRRPVHRRR
jgi:hypothetical protein